MMRVSGKKLGLVLVCAVATVSAGLLVQAQDDTKTAATAKPTLKKNKHRASKVRPFKPGSRFECTVVSNEPGGFKKDTYTAGTDTVTCVFTDKDSGDTKPWTFVRAKRHANPKRLTLVFVAQDIDPPAPADSTRTTATTRSFITAGGTIAITIEDGGDQSSTDPGFEFDVEPIDVDPCG
jgi:hypothetical protein